MIHKSGSTHRDAGKDLIVRIVKSWPEDISSGKNLILAIAAMPENEENHKESAPTYPSRSSFLRGLYQSLLFRFTEK
jgi:hypothetical protein